MIQNASNSGHMQVMHNQSGNPAMIRLLASLAGGLDHLCNLGNDPLAPFKDTTICAKVMNTHQGEDCETNNDLDRQAVEQELWHYEEDSISNIKLLVVF